MHCFAVRDRKAQVFNRPFFDVNKVQAIRGFNSACKEANSPFAQYPDDYELVYLGTFDEASGKSEWLGFPEVLAEPRNFVSAEGVGASVKDLREAVRQ